MSTRKHATRSTGISLLTPLTTSPSKSRSPTLRKTRKTTPTTKGKIKPTETSDIISVAGILGYSGFHEMAKLSLTNKKIQAEMDEKALVELVEENIRIAEIKKEARALLARSLPESAEQRIKIYYDTLNNLNDIHRQHLIDTIGPNPPGTKKRWPDKFHIPMRAPSEISRKRLWNKGKFEYENKIANLFLQDKITIGEFRDGLVYAENESVKKMVFR
tara:strand:+ start:14 stop:664 length:651 start_codon:yes stop_codon:yes gene_type:complete